MDHEEEDTGRNVATGARARHARRERSYLTIISPVATLLVCVSPFSIKSRDGYAEISVASRRRVVFCYILLLHIFVAQLFTLWRFLPAAARGRVPFWYHGAKTLASFQISYSILTKRDRICDVLNRLNKFNTGLPRYYIAFPVCILAALMILASEPIFIGSDIIGYAFVAVHVIAPTIAPMFHTFIYVCQVAVLTRGVEHLNTVLRQCLCNPFESGTLRSAKRYHYSLKAVFNDLNAVSGLQAFLTSVITCMDITICLYFTYTESSIYEMFIGSLCAVLSLLPESFVMITCQQVENALEEAKALSTEILLLPTLSRKIRNEAYELNLQLKLLPMRFSAMGLFHLNGQQLQAAFSTYITYTVIIIQNTPQ